MPTYNRGHLIGETIESIRSQTFGNWELLIMDDGSDDGTEDVIAQINDERICFFKGPRTGHVSKLKNMAMERSRGTLIAFIDSDDLWASTKLEKQIALLEQYPEAGFCLTGGFTFNDQHEPVQYLYQQRNSIRFDDLLPAIFRSEVSGFTQALLFRKDCVPVSGYFDESKLFSDPDFIVSLACHYKGLLLYEPLFFRRLLDRSDSDIHWEKRYTEWVGVIRSYRNKKRLAVSEAKQALYKLYINFGEKCIRKQQPAKAIKQFCKAWINNPASIVPLKKTAKAIWYRVV